MKFKLTKEQEEIIEAINSGINNLIGIEASAGSSKSSTVCISLNQSTTPHRTALILAFGSKIAKENKKDFPEWCEVRTIHSLAYKYIVSPLGLTVKNSSSIFDFTKGRKRDKEFYLSILKKYCQSDKIKVSEFLQDQGISPDNKGFKLTESAIKQVMMDTESGKINASHNVYIKLFQIHLVSKTIDVDKYDLIFLDEFQDASPCMYSIFMNLTSKVKVGVGDSSQKIFGWAGATNAMEKLIEDKDSKVLSLSKSFRCSTDIARAVNNFCNSHMKSPMTFEGSYVSPEDEKRLNSFGHQFRTNKTMIDQMIVYMNNKVRFSLGRSASNIFNDIIYVMIGAKKEHEYVVKNGKHSEMFNDDNLVIYHEYEEYLASGTKASFPLWLSMHMSDEESNVNQSVARIGNTASGLKTKDVLDLKKYCTNKNNNDDNFLVLSAHASKGLSIDCVYIDDSLNEWTEKSIDESEFLSDESELYLYYVATTRARRCLINAKLLDDKGYYGSSLSYDDFISMVESKQGRKSISDL